MTGSSSMMRMVGTLPAACAPFRQRRERGTADSSCRSLDARPQRCQTRPVQVVAVGMIEIFCRSGSASLPARRWLGGNARAPAAEQRQHAAVETQRTRPPTAAGPDVA